jgi:hypothetical protein
MSEPARIQRGSKQRPRKEYPYYKIQIREEKFVAWKDLPKAHQTEAEARRFIAEQCRGQTARIVIVEGDRSRRVLE